jgi:hypothetical protein
MITWQNVVNVAAELASFPTGGQAVMINLAYLEMDSAGWGANLDTGAALLAAHLATVANRKGKPGAPTGYRVGSVSSSWASVNASPSLLDATSYGQIFKSLMRSNPRFRFAVGRARTNQSIWASVSNWAPNTLYGLGALVWNAGNVYVVAEVVGAGESGSGTGPSGIGTMVPDFQTPGTNGLYWFFLGPRGWAT